jgi:uncharacterized protein (TIGR02757 family)
MNFSKKYLDDLVKEFETPEFIKDDPVQFPHRYSDKKDIEISGFISSVFAYGNRKKIIQNLECIHSKFDGEPYKFVKNFDMKKNSEFFKGFCYRFNKENDIIFLIHILKEMIEEFNSLENAFMEGFSEKDKNIRQALISFVDKLRRKIPCEEDKCRKSFFHLIPSPEKGSSCKRFNLFLKWMVRKGPVDFNLWKNIPEEKLIIPLDVHVSKVSRLWKLTERKCDDWRTAEEITENLKKYDSKDPVKYDFAIFGAGIYHLV